jgi:hypothetical protein
MNIDYSRFYTKFVTFMNFLIHSFNVLHKILFTILQFFCCQKKNWMLKSCYEKEKCHWIRAGFGQLINNFACPCCGFGWKSSNPMVWVWVLFCHPNNLWVWVQVLVLGAGLRSVKPTPDPPVVIPRIGYYMFEVSDLIHSSVIYIKNYI